MDLLLEWEGTHAFIQQLFIEPLPRIRLYAGALDTWEIEAVSLWRRQVSVQAEEGHLGGCARKEIAWGWNKE